MKIRILLSAVERAVGRITVGPFQTIIPIFPLGLPELDTSIQTYIYIYNIILVMRLRSSVVYNLDQSEESVWAKNQNG